MKLKRPLYGPAHDKGPSHGADVVAIKRGLSKVETGFFSRPEAGFDDVYNLKTVEAVIVKRQKDKREKSGPFRQDDLDALWPFMDSFARLKYRSFIPQPILTPEEIRFNKLVASMKQMSDHTPGYQLGGGHGIPLYRVSSFQRLDCSSSTSKALYDAGMFPDDYAWVSGKIAWAWGEPGPGKYFSIYANTEHVWIRLHKTKWWRFDTSPHGDGGRGPKLRMLPRFSSSFAVRHYPDM